MKIAIDAMGGDFAPEEIVKGAVSAVNNYPQVEIFLVGDKDKIERELENNKALNHPKITIYHASEVIEMHEQPANALRKKKDASIVVATRLVREKICDAAIAAGSTGAAVSAALLGLGRIKGIDRPAIATPFPTQKGYTVMLDSGANANSKPKNLVQSAIMGYHYARLMFNIDKPSIGLLSIGEESSKGNDLVKETYPLLEQLKTIPFYGNVEGRDIPKGTVDVVVCDGFVGNVVLKLAEGVIVNLANIVKECIMNSGWMGKLGALLLQPTIKKLKKQLDYTEYGGAPLLGVNGIFLISHGSSKAKQIDSAVRIAAELVEKDLVQEISKSLEEEGVQKDD